MIKDRSYWAPAAKYGPDFITDLKAFQAMHAGFGSGAFAYDLFFAKNVHPHPWA